MASINKVKKMYLVNLDYNIDKTGQLFSQIIKIEDDEFDKLNNLPGIFFISLFFTSTTFALYLFNSSAFFNA